MKRSSFLLVFILLTVMGFSRDVASDYRTLTDWFNRRTYDASERKYTVEDIRAPRELIADLTNRGISFLALLRNEISARHGYDFQSGYLNQTLEQTSWYRYNPAFVPETGLTGFEELNVKFLKRMEEIDAAYSGRQLAVVLNFPKEELTTDEALKVWAATGDTNILTSVRDPDLIDFMDGGQIYARLTVSNQQALARDYTTRIEAIFYLEETQVKTFLLFHKDDRLLMNVGGSRLLQECVYENTNVGWAYRESLSEGTGERGIAPDFGLGGIGSRGELIFTKLIYDGGYVGTRTVEELKAEGLLPIYSEEILHNSLKYFQFAGGFGRRNIYYNDELLWCFRAFNVMMIESEYLIRERGRSIYLLVPFDYRYYGGLEIKKLAYQYHFLSGVKVFKITVLD